MRPPLELATRCVRSLSLRRALTGWSRSLSTPVQRSRRMSAQCQWVLALPGPPTMRRTPLFGCLGEVLTEPPTDGNGWDGEASPRPAAAPQIRSSPKRRAATRGAVSDPDTVCSPETVTPRRHEPAPCPPPEAAKKPRERKLPADPPEITPARPRRPPPCPVPAVRAGRRQLCELAGQAEEPKTPSPPRSEVPVPPAARSEPRPAPCSPAAPWTAATNRLARRLRPAAATESQEQLPSPGRQPVTGAAATAGLLYRYAVAPRHHGVPAGKDVADSGVERRRVPPSTAAPTGNRTPWHHPLFDVERRHGTTSPVPEHGDAGPRPAPRGDASAPPLPRGDVSVAPLVRDDLPVPVAPPTASERLGPAPLVTTSRPALVEPDPVGAPTVPVAAATLREGAARDAAAPGFLDGAELTRRMAQVLRDEARRHGIEV